jgi:hypothetical protein
MPSIKAKIDGWADPRPSPLIGVVDPKEFEQFALIIRRYELTTVKIQL